MLLEWRDLASSECSAMAEKGGAALVMGSCEQHGLHLPLGTDVYLGEAVMRRAAERAVREVVLLPSVAYGFSAHHMDFPGSITLTQKTLAAMITEVMSGVISAGFTKAVLVVSHGGNSPAVHTAVNELGIAFPQCSVAMLRYWDFMTEFMETLRDSPLGGIGHAGEMETSMMMALYPHLVGDGWENYSLAQGNDWYHPDMFAHNRVTVYRRFRDKSPYGNVGVCQDASREKGEKILSYLGEELGKYLDGYFI